MTSIFQAGAVAVVTLGAGAATVSVMKDDPPGIVVPDGPWEIGTVLDERVFYTVDTIQETGEVVQDELHFADGKFQSSMCQTYCDFGWSDYRTWTEGEVTHFSTTTRCPDAPHTVVWYGTVTGDDVRFKGKWTTRRWYWTRQLNVVGEGSVTSPEGKALAG